jgi:hypothetical protein
MGRVPFTEADVTRALKGGAKKAGYQQVPCSQRRGMSGRLRLPNRRASEMFELEFGGIAFSKARGAA